MCTVLLPPGVNPTAVNKYINIIIIFLQKHEEERTIGRPRNRWQKIINTKHYDLKHTAPKRILNYITSYYANKTKSVWKRGMTCHMSRIIKPRILLLLHSALWNLCIVHSPTNLLFIKLGNVSIYIKMYIIIAPTCFGLRPSSGSLYRAWLKLHFC
jgi:hypothetical protein